MSSPTADQITARLAGAPVMARVDRSGFVESVHRALACVTTAKGAVQAAWGEPVSYTHLTLPTIYSV